MLDKEQAKSKLKALVEQFSQASKNKDYINSQNEEWIKWNFLEPLLEDVLGWKKSDIEKEKRILKGRADYMLKLGNEEVLVVEAKKAGVSLSEDEGRQAVSYAYHRKVKFAIVTNFKEIRVYHALTNTKNIDHNLLKFEDKGLFRFNFEQFVENIDKLMLLSRENFEKKEINKLLPSKLEKASKPIDESILDDLLQFRDWLSKDLKKTRMNLSKEQIDEVVQILIDRLIFMRSVEDRGLEPKNFLLGLIDDVRQGRTDKNLWTSLKSTFKTFDKSYNSKLFAEGLLEKEGFFDEQTLVKVIRGLYFSTQDSQARYMFDEIPGDLLGSIYEQYLGTILQGTEKRVKLEEGSGKRKKMGIYYTPSYIVDYIVKNTVGEYIKNKTIDEILEVKIVDPACGSGSFIVRAFQEICNAIEERLKKGEKGKMSSFQSYRERLSFSQKISILVQCIYGVDLDEKAVELAQLNLLLKLLEDETPESHKRLLPNLKENIKCGNSLIDDQSIAGDKAFKWEAQFQDVFKGGGFDVVVGNPPWSSKIVSNEVNSFLAKKFSLSQKNMNIFGVFVIHSLKLLKERGIFGLLIPKVIIKNEAYAGIRKEILGNHSMFQIMDFGQFPGVASDAVCLLIEKKRGFQPIKIQFFEASKLSKENNLKEDVFSYSPSFVFSLSTDNKIQRLLDKINKDSKRLSDLFKIRRGIELGQKSLIVKCSKCGNYNEANTKYYGKSDKKCKECGSKLIIDNKTTIIISSTEENEEYNSEAIAGNQLKRYALSGKYYILPRLKGIDYKEVAFDGPKILIKRINTKIEGTFTKSKLFAFNTVYSLYDNPSEEDYLLTLAILNSKLISFYYEFSYNVGMNLTTQVTIDFLSRVPIKISSKEQQKIIVKLTDQMLSLQKRYHEQKLSGNEKERLEQQIKNLDYEIDQEVYELYGITKEEQKIIEDSLK